MFRKPHFYLRIAFGTNMSSEQTAKVSQYVAKKLADFSGL
jgi:hypothetical protein